MRFLTSVFILGLIVLGGAYFWFQSQIGGDISQEISLSVDRGSSFHTVLGELKSLDPAFPSFAMKIYLKVNQFERSLKPGEYRFEVGESYKDVVSDLVEGKVVTYKVTIPEGYNSFEVAELLAKKGFIDSPKKFLDLVFSRTRASRRLGNNAYGFEGYLFPTTYELSKSMSEADILELMVAIFEKEYSSLAKKYVLPQGMDKHDLVTLASVVEKETGAAWERPLIASVFYNRLKKSMRLQSDPTTIYGEWVQSGKRLMNIRKSHLQRKTPYNTYAVSGLPRGPIANPGSKALEAVLNPKKSDFLYFVSKNDGTHYFSKSYREHQNAVRDYQLRRSARKGKSWRDLKQ